MMAAAPVEMAAATMKAPQVLALKTVMTHGEGAVSGAGGDNRTSCTGISAGRSAPSVPAEGQRHMPTRPGQGRPGFWVAGPRVRHLGHDSHSCTNSSITSSTRCGGGSSTGSSSKGSSDSTHNGSGRAGGHRSCDRSSHSRGCSSTAETAVMPTTPTKPALRVRNVHLRLGRPPTRPARCKDMTPTIGQKRRHRGPGSAP